MYTPNCTPNRPFPLKPLAAAVLLVCASGIHSAPILDTPNNKDITVDLSVGQLTTVTQHAERAVANWKEFSIAEGETVKFVQPGANSVILNRVVGGDPSQILGELQANGRVFLINPNGIVFGAKSQVNVGGLVASTLSLKPGFQGNGDVLELQAETTSGEIKNLGSIHAKDIVFLAPVINNTGSLNASAAVNLIAASEVTANLAGADMVFTVKAGHENALIDQLGSVLAAGGKIVLLATSSINGADSVINTAGINQASQISIQGDTVQLTGTFNASNPENALQVKARKINQNAALTVAGSSQMIADEVTLGHAGNDFTGQVSLNVNGAAELKDLNSLSVSGKADGLVLNAADIIQTGAVDVQNATTLTANTVALNNAGNDFKGQVNLAVTGNTDLRDANTLTVAGTSATANLNAADIAVNGLTTTGNLNIAATNTAALNNVAAGSLGVNANSIDQTQTGAVEVQNATTLTATTVTLQNSGNDFKGQVNLAVTDQTDLRDINDLVVTGDVKDAALHGDKLLINGLRATGDLVLKANAVDQNPDLPNAVTVQGATRIEALAENTGNFNLNNSGNDFVGTVDLVDVGVATLFDKNSLFVEGRAGVLTLTADHVGQQQGDKLEVEQTARINAASVLLSNPENNFKGLVDLNVSGMATLHDASTLQVAGKANDARLNAVRIEIDGVLNVTENLTLIASEITQNAAIIVGGETGINGTESAVLGNADNDFVGAVHLKNTANAVLQDKNKITVAGNAGSLTVNAPSVTSGEVVLGDLTANSLTVNAVEVSQINSTLAEEVVVEGVSILNAGKVVLQNEGNDFKGQVNLAVTDQTKLRDANALAVAGTSETANLNAADIAVNGLTTTGNLNIAATNTAALNNVAAGSLGVIANSIDQTQTGAVEVQNATTLTANTVALNNEGNDFKGQVNLAVTGQADLRDANTLTVAGTSATANLNAADIAVNGLTTTGNLNIAATNTAALNNVAAGSLGVNATSIDQTQTGAVEVQNDTTLVANAVTLQNSGNDFKGQVNLAVTDQTKLRDANTLTVAGTSATANLNAADIAVNGLTTTGNLNIAATNTAALNNVAAGSLGVNATSIDQIQTGAVEVQNDTTLVANAVTLQNSGNDFKGQVNLAVTGQTALRDANALTVAGRVKNATIDAQKLTLNGLSAAGDITLKAEEIGDGQNGAVVVAGRSTLQGGAVKLDNSGNRFDGVVNLGLNGAARVHSSENLEVTGRAASVSASAGQKLTVSSLNSKTIELDGKQVHLNGFSTTGDLILNGGEVTQQGVLTVDGVTTLGAATVTLDDAGNDFKNTVVLSSAGDVKIHDANSLALQGDANTLTVHAGGDVNQFDALVVTKASDIAATNINLNNGKNVFGGAVTVAAAQSASVHSDQNLVVGGRADALNAVAGENLSLSSTTAGTLNATGNNIKHAASTDSLQVNGPATLTAQNVDLKNASNDFKGTLGLAVAGQVDIVDGNDLAVKGRAQVLNATVGGTLTAGDLEIRSGSLIASTIQMNQLNVQEKVRLQAAAVNQTEANQSGGEITIAADTVNLSLENDFKGEVVLDNVGTASIHDNNQLVLSGSAKSLAAKARQIKQTDRLKVQGGTQLSAESIELTNANNDFEGVVELQVTDKALLRDMNSVAVRGNVGELVAQATNTLTLGSLQAGSLKTTANVLDQSAAVNVRGDFELNTKTANLIDEGNTFQGRVVMNGGNNTLHTAGDLKVQGRSAELNLNAKNVTQSNTLTVTGPAALSADQVLLADEKNDFQAAVKTTATGNVSIKDQNNLSISGSMNQLDIAAAKALTINNLTAEVLNAQADQIELGNLAIGKSTQLGSRSVTQGESLSLNGETTVQAASVKLDHKNNDFGGVLNLSATEFAEIVDANTLTLGDVQGAGVLKLSAQSVNQRNAINHSGSVDINSANVELNRIDNDFSGRVAVNSDNAVVVDSNSLSMDFVGRNLSAIAKNLEIESIQASGDVVLSAETANVSSQHDLSIQGNVGDLSVQANRLTQTQALTVRNRADLQAAALDLLNVANDFQGEVVLNVSGSTNLNDANALLVSGKINGPAQLKAQSIQQTKALNATSSLALQASQIVLDNNANTLDGVVRIEGEGQASQATLHSQGKLSVQGANIEGLKLVSKEAVLGDLGELQQLQVTAEKVTQGAALLVRQQTLLNADHVNLSDSNNDFVGEVSLRGKDSSLPEVAIADKNSLSIQADNVKLAAQVQGDLGLTGQNAVLGTTTVAGSSNINLTGALTQDGAVNLNNAVLKADSIGLNESGNRFGGTTQLDSAKTIEISTSGDLNADTGSSTGALALNVAGNTTVNGAQVVFAQSRLDGNLKVNANDISQTDSLHVGGTAELDAVGGNISLQHANNQFQGNVSATAERTDIAARGNLRVMNLMSRGGQITADGQLLLLGRIEQTGGTLNFIAKGALRPLSSAEIAMLLPPALDVFSAKEAVDPITGLGRITLASAAIHQQSGQITTAEGSMTQFHSTANGSVVLTKNNQINGQFAALSGKTYGQAYGYNPGQGASLFAVNNDVQLRVASMGVEADVVAIRARGLSTTGEVSQIRARMPYNDISAGTSRSFAGLTLSIPTGGSNGQQGNIAPFGELSGVGQSAVAGAIRVEIGEVNRAGFGGFVTVLPFEGNNLLPGQVVYLAGPERKGTYAFFYDGARNLNRVPVVYNGSLLASPQESAALTTAQGAVVLARQEQTRSVVRTENVAGKIINGVVLEVGPGRPATEGTGGAGKPASCDAAGEGLSCNP